MRRAAVVTGGAGGLGAVIVERLAAHGPVVVLDRVEPAGAVPDGVVHRSVDVTDVRSIERALSAVDVGPLLALVCCAGVGPGYELLAEVEAARFGRALDVNVLGALNVARLLAPQMREHRSGRIVNISSVTAVGGWRRRGEYAASKAALESVSATLAVELGGAGITVNCVAPGHIRTSMTEAAAIPWAPIEHRTALGRLVTPDEVAAAVEFLLSDGASGITGSVVRVDAGYLANQLTTAEGGP